MIAEKAKAVNRSNECSLPQLRSLPLLHETPPLQGFLPVRRSPPTSHKRRPATTPAVQAGIFLHRAQHDCCRVGAWKMFESATLICARHHMATLFRLSWSATTTAESLLPVPMDHRTGIKKKSPILWRQRSAKFTQL